jgi:DNA (cytosine-5)-methyltransferase 1
MNRQKYKQFVNCQLGATSAFKYKAIDLFCGCGGLSLGFESEGVLTKGVDISAAAVKTYNKNLVGTASEERLTQESKFEFSEILLAGPPCQPYSVAGKRLGGSDSRDGFPIVLNAISRINPKVVVLENVKGLAKKKQYFNNLLLQLRNLEYHVSYDVLNAKHFNVPQNRDRLFIVATKKKMKFEFPKGNSRQITVGESIGHIKSYVPTNTKLLTPNIDKYILKYEVASKCKQPRDLHLDKPSRTVTCRNLGGSTGDMLRLKLSDGSRRTLSIREGATLQGFPSWFRFNGTKSEILTQIGNAVPPLLAKAIAKSVVEQCF